MDAENSNSGGKSGGRWIGVMPRRPVRLTGLSRVCDQLAHHLGEAQRHDGEIIAAEPEHREPQQQSGERADADTAQERQKTTAARAESGRRG
jgi:hypothetical protein